MLFKNSKKAIQMLYIIQMGDTEYYKIGITDNINRRLAQLQCGNPFNLKMIYYWGHTQRKVIKKYERVLHKYFIKQEKRTETAKEWFKLDKEDLELLTSVNNVKAQNELIEKILKIF